MIPGALARVHDYTWLNPPSFAGTLNITHVDAARSPEEHERTVRRWAAHVWDAWRPHHPTIREWAASLL